jgi:hypothetical protein
MRTYSNPTHSGWTELVHKRQGWERCSRRQCVSCWDATHQAVVLVCPTIFPPLPSPRFAGLRKWILERQALTNLTGTKRKVGNSELYRESLRIIISKVVRSWGTYNWVRCAVAICSTSILSLPVRHYSYGWQCKLFLLKSFMCCL